MAMGKPKNTGGRAEMAERVTVWIHKAKALPVLE